MSIRYFFKEGILLFRGNIYNISLFQGIPLFQGLLDKIFLLFRGKIEYKCTSMGIQIFLYFKGFPYFKAGNQHILYSQSLIIVINQLAEFNLKYFRANNHQEHLKHMTQVQSILSSSCSSAVFLSGRNKH